MRIVYSSIVCSNLNMIGTSLPIVGCFHKCHRYLLVRCFSGNSTSEGSPSLIQAPILLIVSAAFGRPRVSKRIDCGSDSIQ